MPTDDSTWEDSQSPSDELDNQSEEREEAEDQSPGGKKSAEERIQQLVAQNKEANERIKNLEGQIQSAPAPVPTPPVSQSNPAAQKVAEQIKELGFVNEDKFNEKFEELQARVHLDNLHGQLEQRFDGSDGLPKYDRGEVEKFMREQGVSNPEWAYEKLYPTEFLDWKIKQAQKPKGQPHTETPSAPRRADDREITREKIKEWLDSGPEGRARYEQNRDKILALMKQGQL